MAYTGKQARYTIYTPVQLLSKVQALALDLAGGYTANPPSNGAWRDDTGKVNLDEIVKVDVITHEESRVIKPIVRALKEAGELSVLVERHQSAATFY